MLTYSTGRFLGGETVKIGEILVYRGYADVQSIETALRLQNTTRKALGQILIDLAHIKEEDLQHALFVQRNAGDCLIVNFLQRIKPFKKLYVKELELIAQTMEWKDFRPGQTIIGDLNKGTHLYLIKDGLVRVYVGHKNREMILGYLEKDECFGEMSLLTDVDTGSYIAAIEWTRCLVQNRNSFLDMVGRHPEFKDFYINLFMQRISNIYQEILAEAPGMSRVEPFLYRKQVNDLIGQHSVSCNEGDSIRSVATVLIEKKASTAMINDATGMIGLVGLREIIKALAMEERELSEPVRSIIRKDYFTINGNDYVFDAIHEMMKHKTSKLVVIHKGKPIGILTGFDLLRFRGRDVLTLIRNIESAPDLPMLDTHRQEVGKVLRALMADGATASHICKIISALNDKITRKVVMFVENELGKAPTPYAWLGLGSEGRQEQTILTDQDNGLMFSSAAGAQAAEYFSHFSVKVVNSLKRCGFPACKGNIMATNRKYYGTLDSWKRRAEDLIFSKTHDYENMIDRYVFLDFRTVYGNKELEKDLRSHIFKCIRNNPHFLEDLADAIASIPLPLGIFKNLIVEKNGKHKNKVNFKNLGLLPLTSCLKILAFYCQLEEVNSLDRLKALGKQNVFLPDETELFRNALETFLMIKIENNLHDLNEGRDFGNHIDPNTFTNHQKQSLKEAFSATSHIQKKTRNIIMAGRKDMSWENTELGKPY